MTIVGSGYSVT